MPASDSHYPKFLVMWLASALFACHSPQPPPGCAEMAGRHSTTIGGYRVEGDSLVLPSFEVEVRLSDKAQQKLRAAKETVVVAAYFSAVLRPSIAEYPTKDGTVMLASSEQELANNRIARFEGVKVAKTAFCQLTDGEIELLVNVVSGRKSTADNLLNCETVQEELGSSGNKKYRIRGRLIGEK